MPDEVRVQLRQLVEVVGYLPRSQPLGVITADAVLLAANRPLLDLLGATGDEILDDDWDDFLTGWEERVAGPDGDPDARPRTRAFDAFLKPKAGDPLWVSVVASPVFTPTADGDPDGALAAWTLFVSHEASPSSGDDQQRRAEILDLLLESPTEYVVQFDGEGSILFLSPSIRRALGTAEGASPATNLVELHANASDGAFHAEFRRLMDELMRPPYRAEREMAMATVGGERLVQWNYESLLADGGEIRSVLGVGRDVTERRRAERALRHRLDLETMMSGLSSRFTHATLESTTAVVDCALSEVGLHLGADRICLYEVCPDGTAARDVRVWRCDGSGVGSDAPVLDLTGLPWLHARLTARELVAVATPSDLPAEAVREREVFSELGLASVLVVPITQDVTLAGFLAVAMRLDRPAGDGDTGWRDDDVHLLSLLADQLAGLLVWRVDEENLRAISECFLAFGPVVNENLGQICRAAACITGAEFSMFSRRLGDDLVIEAGWNVPDDIPRVTPASGRACTDVMARPDDTVHVIRDLQDTVYAHTSPILRGRVLRTYAGFSVIVGGRAIATLCCLLAGDVTFRESQLELLRVLGRAASVEEERRGAVEERLVGLAELEQAMERTVGTLSEAMSVRDPYTAGHQRRVARLAAAIGGELGMDEGFLRLLRLAAVVHDVGKISVPTEILSKPSRLSEAEFAIVRTHSEAGHALLAPAGLPVPVTDAVLQHHERLDGSGYPAGLEGDEIGQLARILAVADVVEAMSSHRPYRPSLGIGPALEEIRSGRGTRYDAEVVDACCTLFDERGFILED